MLEKKIINVTYLIFNIDAENVLIITSPKSNFININSIFENSNKFMFLGFCEKKNRNINKKIISNWQKNDKNLTYFICI